MKSTHLTLHVNTIGLRVVALFLIIVSAAVLPVRAQISATIALKGTITEETTRKPTGVSIVILDANGKKVTSTKSNATTGEYYILLKPGMKFSLQFEGERIFKETVTTEIPALKKYAEITRDWLVHTNVPGTKLKPSVSPFEYKKTKLRVGGDEMLDVYTELMKSNPSAKFDIRCYPDASTSEQAATAFTSERARNLREYFIAHGVSETQVQVKANGVIDPENPIPQGKAVKGRRYVGSTYIVVAE